MQAMQLTGGYKRLSQQNKSSSSEKSSYTKPSVIWCRRQIIPQHHSLPWSLGSVTKCPLWLNGYWQLPVWMQKRQDSY